MKHLLVAALAVAAVTGSTMPAFADGSGTVNGHVVAASPCITIDTTDLDYGVMPFSTSNDLNAGKSAASIAVNITNCGGLHESLLAHGTDGVPQGGQAENWTLTEGGVCPTPNLYQLVVRGRPLTLNDQNLGALGDQQTTLGLELHMPCVGSINAGHQINFSFVLTALQA